MDPFTERMLERARARREKLNAQLSNIGQLDVNATKNPNLTKTLHESERNLVIEKSKILDSDDNKSSTITKTVKNITSPGETSIRNKENSAADCKEVNFRSSARSRLKRLGVLYSNNAESNDPEEMPSPIRAELKVYKDETSQKKKMPVHTLQRMAALANHINHWEDDVGHPKMKEEMNELGSPSKPSPVSKAARDIAGKCGLQDHKEVAGIQLPTTDSNQKALVWDREVIANLESQGFRPTTSGSHLVYDYTNESSPGHTKEVVEPLSGASIDGSPSRLEPPNMEANSPQQHHDIGAKKLTPRQTPVHGSVLHRAALFESPTRSPKAKDPAELSIAERKALFEKNKGQALVPKAAFSMAVPMKQLASSPKKIVPTCHSLLRKPDFNEPNCLKSTAESLATFASEVSTKVVSSVPETREVCANPPVATSKVLDRCHIFEKGKPVQILENDILKNVKSERQRELEMLSSRWNNQREAETKGNTMTEVEEQSRTQSNTSQPTKALPPPPPPPMPMFSPSSGRRGVLVRGGGGAAATSLPSSPVSACISFNSPHSEKILSLASMRKIKVSPAKPGFLYPSLSDIEVTESEMDVGESEGENESFGDLEREGDDKSESYSSSCEVGDTSFGMEIFQAAGIDESYRKRRYGGALSSAEKAAFDKMDEFLNEALEEEDIISEGPTPQKCKSADSAPSDRNMSKGKGISAVSTEIYNSNLHSNEPVSPLIQQEYELGLPLMHTVSFYRKQQAKASPCPSVVRHVNHDSSNKGRSKIGAGQDSEQAVQEKMKSLLDEVSRQQTIMSQASQALNLCSSTIEFSESAEQAEGERLLLVATHRRQAVLNEIQRLRVEGTLWPKPSAEFDMLTLGLEKGDLEISGICLPLKKEFLQKVVNGEVDFTHHFVCLVKHQEKVIATEMLSTANVCKPQGRMTCSLHFNSFIRLPGLYSDFKVTLEIYGLPVRKEVLSHEAKYHIRKDTSKIRITPKKLLKQESNLIMPIVQSPAGPLAVRSTAFALAGYIIFSLRELSRVQWTLNKVPYSSPLEGVVQMKLKCQLEQNAEERGFLTMFEDIGGFGAWHRRWCVLHEDRLSFWKYPEDERRKEPIGWINLNACSNENVGPVARHICARPNTFLLETKRAPLPEDRDSLVLITSSSYTTIRHLLSADSKEERQLWCSQINKAIRSLRAWGPRV